MNPTIADDHGESIIDCVTPRFMIQPMADESIFNTARNAYKICGAGAHGKVSWQSNRFRRAGY